MRHLVVAYAFLIALVTSCAGEIEEPGYDPDDVHLGDPEEPDVLAAGGRTVRVVQMNPYYAGRLAPYTEHQNSCAATSECSVSGRKACVTGSADGCWECIDHACRQRTFETAKHAAGLFDAIRAEVIGIEELDPQFAARNRKILETATGVAWDFRMSEQGINGKGSGVGVFWRTDRIELVADLGHVDVDTLPSGYIVRYHGVVLRPKGTNRQFAMFAGKLYWERNATALRVAEAKRLRAFIDSRLAMFPAAKARIVASDFNDTPGSSPYDVFADYDDGDARKATSTAADPSRRIDYLFWASSSAGASVDGFVTARSDHRLGRSEYYGSDHRFVYGDALVP